MPSRLTRFGLMAKEHWKKYLPKMYKELEKSGELEEYLYQAQERTKAAILNLVENGTRPDEAWELVKEEWILLPTEEDQKA